VMFPHDAGGCCTSMQPVKHIAPKATASCDAKRCF
jgi:hypothetical protein